MSKGDRESQRQLTKAEAARKERFEATKTQLEADGYQTVDLTVGMVHANVMALVLGLPIVVLLGVLFLFNNPVLSGGFQGLDIFQFFLVLIILIPIHEFIHGLFWAIFAKGHWQGISFGFIVRYLTPYCTCMEPLRKGQYIIGGIMPTVILGLLPAVVAIFTGSGQLFWIGAIMILCGGGDLTIILKLLRFQSHSKDVIYIDHPYQGGLVAFVR